jgi:phage/plasmid-like protein (TIGR03299 family)
MSAQVEQMYSVRQTPWHRQGTVISEYPGSWAEARKLAGLDWDAITEPVYGLSGIDGNGAPIYNAIEGHKQIVRSDTGKTLSVVSDTYAVIDHTDMGEIVEAVLRQENVRYETAGVLDEGRAVWCLALLDEPIHLPGDDTTVTYPYLAITNRHDGGGACALRATAVRIVCMNTFRAAEMEGERTGATFSFRHTKGWRNRVEEARDAVTGARREIRDYVELATELIGHTISAAQRELFVTAFIPEPPSAMISDRVAANVSAARDAIRTILASETTAPVAHTAYGLVQAAGEYLDHVRKARTWETRLGRTLLRPEDGKRRALSIVRQVVKTGA